MDETIKLYLDMAEDSMTNSIRFLDEALAHIRAGKANPKTSHKQFIEFAVNIPEHDPHV